MKHLFILMLFLFPLFSSRAIGQKVKIFLKEKDTISLIQTSIENILDNLDKFDSIWVEIEGTYHYGYEFYAIFPYKNPGKPRETFYGLWTAYDMNLFKKGSVADSLSKLNNKKVRIKGRISKQDQGHLSKFAASIKNIYSIEEL